MNNTTDWLIWDVMVHSAIVTGNLDLDIVILDVNIFNNVFNNENYYSHYSTNIYLPNNR